ncbi:MAG: OmpA family protein [Scytolyngbya sp. HA4215-MV1]|nr:OmpA family protein [Scytolyngbya sp. HA4215-MV1]
MQRHSNRQPRLNPESSQPTLSLKPRPFSDPMFDQPDVASTADFSHVDLFSHAPQRPRMPTPLNSPASPVGLLGQPFQTVPQIMRQDAGVPATQTPQAADAGPVAGVPQTASPAPIAEDLRQFREHGAYPADAIGKMITPKTGMGGFNARYDPTSMILTITVNIAMTFVDGLKIEGNRVKAEDPGLQPLADAANRLRGAKRQETFERIRLNWHWNGQEDAWMQTYRQTVSNAWSSAGTGLVFRSTKPNWDSQLAKVQVVVNTWKDTPATGGGAAGAPAPAGAVQPVHCHARILKTKDSNTDVNAEVGPGSATDATDQTLTLGSGQAITEEKKLSTSIFFGSGSTRLNSDARDTLRRFIISFQAPAGGSGSNLTILGHANTRGGTPEQNQKISETRANVVADFLKTTQVEGKTLANAATRMTSVTGGGTTGADEGDEWRRVDITVAGGQGQNVAAHEFGHMIGLDDEYASTPKRNKAGKIVKDKDGSPVSRGLISGTGGEVGDPTATNPLAKDVGLGGSVYENNDNVMSLGNTVRPQHYATFMQALHEVSSLTEWGMKP